MCVYAARDHQKENRVNESAFSCHFQLSKVVRKVNSTSHEMRNVSKKMHVLQEKKRSPTARNVLSVYEKLTDCVYINMFLYANFAYSIFHYFVNLHLFTNRIRQ